MGDPVTELCRPFGCREDDGDRAAARSLPGGGEGRGGPRRAPPVLRQPLGARVKMAGGRGGEVGTLGIPPRDPPRAPPQPSGWSPRRAGGQGQARPAPGQQPLPVPLQCPKGAALPVSSPPKSSPKGGGFGLVPCSWLCAAGHKPGGFSTAWEPKGSGQTTTSPTPQHGLWCTELLPQPGSYCSCVFFAKLKLCVRSWGRW